MSGSPERPTPVLLALAQPLLLLAYVPLAHLSVLYADPRLVAAALAVIVLGFLLDGLWQCSRRAWLGLLLAAALLLWGAARPGFSLALLLVPVVFLGMFSWLFTRTLLPGRTPLISRIVAAMEGDADGQLSPELYRYSRNLTVIWALALGLLALSNLLLALIAVPGGLLAELGIRPVVQVSDRQWSWFANIVNYGVVGLIFVIEYICRAHRFPGRYKSPLDFIRRAAALGPVKWRELLR
ncbi:MAG: ketosynthase [Pseudomonadota bacterium]|nr:ketosynthase [Pseudomonadota bacterium]